MTDLSLHGSEGYEHDPIFAKHCAKQPLMCKSYGLLTTQVPFSRLTGEDFGFATEVIVGYDNNTAGTFQILLYVFGTCFQKRENWLTCLTYWFVSGVVASLIAWDRADGKQHFKPLEDPAQREALSDLSTYFTAFNAFMIGYFVRTMVARWWAMRLWLATFLNSVHDLMSRISARMRSPSDRKFKERMLRLCLLSHRLIVNQARAKESRVDLQLHVDAGLMSEDELAALEGQPCKASIAWMWANTLFRVLCDRGKISDLTPPVVARFDGIFATASGAIGSVLSYIDTQVPFSYVHLLTFMVVANNILIAIKAGILLGRGIGPGGDLDTTILILELIHVVLVPFAYHSFLSMGFELANPFGFGHIDFPGYFLNLTHREMEISCMDAADNIPITVAGEFA